MISSVMGYEKKQVEVKGKKIAYIDEGRYIVNLF